MPAFGGVRGTGDWGPDERPKHFREGILWLNPNGTAPIFALTSKTGKGQSVNDPETSWWAEPNDLVRLQTSVARSNAANQTTITVDSGDPTDATGFSGNNTHYGSARNLAVDDLLMVEPGSDSANFNPEVLRVTSITSPTVFEVARGAAGTNRAAIPDNSFLLKIGNAHAEGTRSPASHSRNPIKYYNYTQIFKNTYEVTGTAMETNARTGDPVKNDKMRAMFDHARDMELALLYGHRNEDADGGTNGKPRRTMGGLREFIPNTVLANNSTIQAFLDAVSPVFDWDSQAGDTRLAFCGNGALNNLNKKLIAAEANGVVRINYDATESMYGVKFTKFRVPQGDLMIKTHPLLSRHPLYTNSMYIVDMSMLKVKPLKNRDTKFKDNIQHNDEDTKKGQWQTECTLMVDGGGRTMKYIGNI